MVQTNENCGPLSEIYCSCSQSCSPPFLLFKGTAADRPTAAAAAPHVSLAASEAGKASLVRLRATEAASGKMVFSLLH